MLLVLVAVAALVIAWQSPLLGTPTAEAALFLGAFLAPVCFLAGSCRGALRNMRGLQDDVVRRDREALVVAGLRAPLREGGRRGQGD